MSVEADIRARLDRIDAENPKLNAFIRIDREESLAAARAADGRPTRLGPLDGLPVAVKDNIAVAGKPLTAGIAGRRDAIAEADAGAVTRLKAAGAVVLGGLNMHEAALGGTTDNAAFGRCGNPLGQGVGQGVGQGFGQGFGPALTPGGSSGGSAAAAAAGLVDIALGSDTMGSVRLPAAYCGVSGIKPTPGLIGRSGFVFLSRSLDTIGPLARDPALLWPALVALAGPDSDDPESEVPPPGWRDRPRRDSLHGLRFAIPAQLAAVDCEPAVLEAFETAKRAVRDLGATVVDIDLPAWDPGRARLSGLIAVEAEGAVELADLIDRPGAMTPTLHAMLDFGRRVAPGRLVRAQAAIRAAGAICRRALAGVDGILMPTAPQLPFPHDAPAPVTQADLTALANFARCPALALPVARDGLPGSVQIVSAPWTEAALTRWGEILAPALNP